MLSSCRSVCKSFRSTTQARKKVHYNVPVYCRISDALRTRKVHVMRSLLCLIVSRAHTWRTLRPDFRWVESTFRNTNRLESSRFESIRQNFSPPCAFIRDLTSGKSSSAKRTSGESEVFDPRADSNRLCFKTIRLSLGVLDMSVNFCVRQKAGLYLLIICLQ